MDNEGEKRLYITGADGKQKQMTFQVTNVNKPLGSVSRICAAGQQVVFNPPGHPDGSYVRNLMSNERIPLREENGTYKLDGWLNPYSPDGNKPGFARQGP